MRLFRVFLHRIQHCIQDELQGVLKDIGLAFDDGSVQGMLQRTDSTLFGFHLLYIVGDDDGGGGGAGGGSCLYGHRKLKGEANFWQQLANSLRLMLCCGASPDRKDKDGSGNISRTEFPEVVREARIGFASWTDLHPLIESRSSAAECNSLQTRSI